jgi:hypothetical protein
MQMNKNEEQDEDRHYIFFIEIEAIKSLGNTIYLIKQVFISFLMFKNSDVDKFTFLNSDRMNQFVSKILVNSKAFASHSITYKKEESKTILDEMTGELVMVDKYYKINPSLDFLFKTEGYFHFERDMDPIQVKILVNEDTIFI